MLFMAEKRTSVDFSAYDATCNSRLLNIIFEELENLFPSGIRGLVKDFTAIKDCFINSQIIMPDGFVYRKDHGVASGSSFTNVVDTIYNYAATKVACANLKIDIDDRNSFFMGDDSSLLFINGDGDYDNSEPLIKAFSSEILKSGLILNPEKCSTGPQFLSRDWAVMAQGTRSIITKLFLPERNRRYQHFSQLQNLLPSLIVMLGDREYQEH